MWDAQAFEVELRIENEVLGEVGLEQFVIFRFENIESERVPAFLYGVDHLFELGNDRLSNERAANVVDLPVDDVSAHFRVARFLQKIMREQFLVEGRCDFGQE